MKDTVEIKKDKIGEYRWHRKAGNNEVISQGEWYETRQGAVEGALRANPDMTLGSIVRVEDVVITDTDTPTP